MLRVTIDILPGGDPSFKRTLGVIDIANVSDLAPVSDYHVDATIDCKRYLSGIRYHNRKDGVIVLVHRALQVLLEGYPGLRKWNR